MTASQPQPRAPTTPAEFRVAADQPVPVQTSLLGSLGKADAPDEATQTGFFTDSTLCIGCKACEVACKQWNALPSDGFNWRGRSHDNTEHLSSTTWRHVSFTELRQPTAGLRWLFNSDVCKHCEQAPCQDVCPTGAILTNEFGNVYIQQDVCNGCGYCVAACPFGVIGRGQQDHTAHKCTLCYDRQRDGLTPACAKACPTESIQFGPIAELRQRASTRLAELRARGNTDAYLYGATGSEHYSPLRAFFLLTAPPSAYNLPAQPVQPRRRLRERWLWSAAAAVTAVAVSAACLLSAEQSS
jgi:formate dehydrogenase iron-sulfur subunit